MSPTSWTRPTSRDSSPSSASTTSCTVPQIHSTQRPLSLSRQGGRVSLSFGARFETRVVFITLSRRGVCLCEKVPSLALQRVSFRQVTTSASSTAATSTKRRKRGARQSLRRPICDSRESARDARATGERCFGLTKKARFQVPLNPAHGGRPFAVSFRSQRSPQISQSVSEEEEEEGDLSLLLVFSQKRARALIGRVALYRKRPPVRAF